MWNALWSPARARWSLAIWLLGLGLVLFIRYPVKFLIEPPYLMDLEAYRQAVERIAQGHAAALYEPLSSERMVFKYAPMWALLLSPLGWMSGHAAAVLWSAVNVIGVAGTCWIADRLCRLMGFCLPAFIAVIGVVSLVRPVSAAFSLGQSDIVWGALISGFLLLMAEGRHASAALCLALAISLKLPAALLLIWLVLRRRVRLAASVLAWLLLLNALCASLLVPSNPLGLFASWARSLAANGASYAFDIGNQSLLALLGRLLRKDGYGFNVLALTDPQVMAVACAIGALLFALLFIPPKKQLPGSGTAHMLIEAALVWVLMVLASPSCWIATYSALLTPAVIALACLTSRPQTFTAHAVRLLAAVLLATLALMTHSSFWKAVGLRYLRGESYVFLVLMILPWSGLALYGWLLYCRVALLPSARRPGAAASSGHTFGSSSTGTALPSAQ